MRNPAIISFFMNNIDMKTVGIQKSVVEKFNKSKVPHYIFNVNMPHGVAIDYFWATNGQMGEKLREATHGAEIEKSLDHDAVLILDIDAIPLSERAIDLYFEAAYAGRLIGNAQRSNHLQNNQHVFAAPSASCLSTETFIKLGMPSAYETQRSDVLEEYTWEAEKIGIPVDLVMPLRYNESPKRYEWEGNQPPYWALADGMPVYGMGTTYGDDEGDLFYHQFQIRMEGQQEKFWQTCESILAGA